MQNQKTNPKTKIDELKAELFILEELDLLESEFQLIQNEYLKRKQHLENRLKNFSGHASRERIGKSDA